MPSERAASRVRIAKAFKGQTAVHGAGPIVVGVLVDTPSDAGLLENVGDGGPFERGAAIM